MGPPAIGGDVRRGLLTLLEALGPRDIVSSAPSPEPPIACRVSEEELSEFLRRRSESVGSGEASNADDEFRDSAVFGDRSLSGVDAGHRVRIKPQREPAAPERGPRSGSLNRGRRGRHRIVRAFVH